MHPYQFNLIDSKSVETNADELCWEEKEACLSKIGSFKLLDCWIVGPVLFLPGGFFEATSPSMTWTLMRCRRKFLLAFLGPEKSRKLFVTGKKHTWTYTNLETSSLISNLNLTRNNFFCNAQRTFASSETHVGWTQKMECTKNPSLANGFSSASKCKMQQLRRCEVLFGSCWKGTLGLPCLPIGR